jgi:hypothetical protein
VSLDFLTSQLQNEHQEIWLYRVNFKEKANDMPKNVQFGNLSVNGKNEPFSCWSIFTDPEMVNKQTKILRKISNFEKMATGKL